VSGSTLQCTSLRYVECHQRARAVWGQLQDQHDAVIIIDSSLTSHSHLIFKLISRHLSALCSAMSRLTWCIKTRTSPISACTSSLSHRVFKAPHARTQSACVGSLNTQRSEHQSKTQRIWADTDASESEDPRHWAELMQITRCAAVCGVYAVHSRFLLFICRSRVLTRRSRCGWIWEGIPPLYEGSKGTPIQFWNWKIRQRILSHIWKQ